MVGRQTPILAVVVPLVLVFVVDGRRGLREAWLPALAAGVTFGVAQFVASNYISVPLTDIVAALVSAAVVVLLVRGRRDRVPAHADGLRRDGIDGRAPRGGDRRRARRGRRHGRRGPRGGAGRAGPARPGNGAGRRRPANVPVHPRRSAPGLRALPDHHRALLARQPHRGQGRPWPRSRGPTSSPGPACTCLDPAASRSPSTTFTFSWLPARRHPAAHRRHAHRAGAADPARPCAGDVRPTYVELQVGDRHGDGGARRSPT